MRNAHQPAASMRNVVVAQIITYQPDNIRAVSVRI